MFAVAVAVVALDVVTKAVAVAELTGQGPVNLVGDILKLRLVRNPGAAFGLAEGSTVLLTCIALIVVVIILRAAQRLRSIPWALALGLVLGGALGNLGDRIFRSPGPLRGHVIDFLELPHWPVFNLADSAIVVGAVLMALLSVRGVPSDGSTRRASGSGPADE